MVKKLLNFSIELNTRLKIYAAEHNTNMQAVIILAVEKFLERESKK